MTEAMNPLPPSPLNDFVAVPRRGFLLAAAALLAAGCAEQKATSGIPGVPWPSRPTTADPPTSSPGAPSGASSSSFPGVISRTRWAKGGPNFSDMDRMLPVRYITIHHDGMSPFVDGSEAGAAARLELIRSAHRGKGWADIGYHFIVDRGGRVWEGRPISYQGAHVKDYNEGNLGVMALGNFDQQSPTSSQVEGVRRHVTLLMQRYHVPVSRVRTHQEWAPTACPGRNFQPQIVRMRNSGAFA